MEKDIIIKINELKTKQILCQLYLAKHKQLAYTNGEVEIMMKNVGIESKLNDIEDEIGKLVVDNKDYFESVSVEHLQELSGQYKITLEQQRQFAKEVLGFETTVDELVDE